MDLAVAGAAGTVALLSAYPPRGLWTTLASEAVRDLGAVHCPVTHGAQVACAKAFTLGRTAQETARCSLAAAEIEALCHFCTEALT